MLIHNVPKYFHTRWHVHSANTQQAHAKRTSSKTHYMLVHTKDLLKYGELASGARTTGRPKLRFKDICKADMKQCNIALSTWESLADDCFAWRQAVWQGTTSAEAAREEDATTNEPGRNCSNSSPSSHPPSSAPSAIDWHSQVGLHSHSWRCN
jgi:hypothetical protein